MSAIARVDGGIMTRLAIAMGFLLLTLPMMATASTNFGLGSIGYYSDGTLDSDSQITGYETGLLKLFPERDRGWGNSVMVELLTSFGLSYAQAYDSPNERLHVGDIAQRGGGQISGHASHQNGLDADLGYFHRDHREAKAFDEKFVKNGKVTANFDLERNWWALKWLYGTGRIDRIFVDREIKRYFCLHAPKGEGNEALVRGEVLRLLRPWPEHDNHFHVRLECPAGNAKCVGSLPVAAGDGCDEKSLHENDGLVSGQDIAP